VICVAAKKLMTAFSGNSSVAKHTPVNTAAGPTTNSTNTGIFELRGNTLVALDDHLSAEIRISLTKCLSLKSLPANLQTGSLDLSGCTAIEYLPVGLEVAFLDLADCTSLKELPSDLRLRGGRLNLRNCAKLTQLPDNIGDVAQLDVSGCQGLRTLPLGLNVTSWIEIGGSGIKRLPAHLARISVRCGGEPIDASEMF
jgi:hypothetical protein